MAVTLAQARTQINDGPRVYPPPSATPEVLGVGDGTTKIFYLKHPNVVSGSLSVYTGTTSGAPPATVWTGVSPSQYTQGGTSTPQTTGPTQALITFTAAPAAGAFIGARYMATVLSDADLNAYISRASSVYSDDRTVLKAVTYDFFDLLFTNLDALKLHRYGEFVTDSRGLLEAIQKHKESLRSDLEGSPIAGRQLPSFRPAARTYLHYTPRA